MQPVLAARRGCMFRTDGIVLDSRIPSEVDPEVSRLRGRTVRAREIKAGHEFPLAQQLIV